MLEVVLKQTIEPFDVTHLVQIPLDSFRHIAVIARFILTFKNYSLSYFTGFEKRPSQMISTFQFLFQKRWLVCLTLFCTYLGHSHSV